MYWVDYNLNRVAISATLIPSLLSISNVISHASSSCLFTYFHNCFVTDCKLSYKNFPYQNNLAQIRPIFQYLVLRMLNHLTSEQSYFKFHDKKS